MVSDRQVRRLWQLLAGGKTLAAAAARTDMDEKTARKYQRLQKLPSETTAERSWRTRGNPFTAVWPEVCALLEENPGLQAKTLFQELQRRYPGQFADGQLRTLQRQVRCWRALSGPPKEVFFAQVHEPGRLAASDFTRMGGLGVTIAGQPFDHMVYHFVLTYSNWETATICFSESFESLSEGLQNALWELGGVPQRHRTDRLSTAVNNLTEKKEFTQRYEGLMHHYGLLPEKIQAGHANENGDIEQRHHRFKQAVDQALMLRGGRDFADRAAYGVFLREVLRQLNAGRQQRLAETAGAAAAAGAAVGGVPEGDVPRGPGQHDSRRAEHLLGVEPADRRAGGGAAVRGAPGSVVCAAGAGAVAASAGSEQVPDQLPARDRLAGAEAGGVRGLSLSARDVPVERVPCRL